MMKKIEDEDILYNELLVIDSNANENTCDVIGISEDGRLLFIKERAVHSGNAYCLRREFYLIDNAEYLKCLGIAAKTIYLQKSISKGTTDVEVCYKGRCFKIGPSIRYFTNHKECSIFTDDMSLADQLEFNRVDKSEYEKTIRIKECDAVRITHKDKESGTVYLQQEFSPSEIEELLINRSGDKCEN